MDEKKLRNPILHANLRAEHGDAISQSDVMIDLAQVSAIARTSNQPGALSRIMLGNIWWAIPDAFDELESRWLRARGITPPADPATTDTSGPVGVPAGKPSAARGDWL